MTPPIEGVDSEGQPATTLDVLAEELNEHIAERGTPLVLMVPGDELDRGPITLIAGVDQSTPGAYRGVFATAAERGDWNLYPVTGASTRYGYSSSRLSIQDARAPEESTVLEVLNNLGSDEFKFASALGNLWQFSQGVVFPTQRDLRQFSAAYCPKVTFQQAVRAHINRRYITGEIEVVSLEDKAVSIQTTVMDSHGVSLRAMIDVIKGVGGIIIPTISQFDLSQKTMGTTIYSIKTISQGLSIAIPGGGKREVLDYKDVTAKLINDLFKYGVSF